MKSWLASGLSCREFARQEGVHPKTLSWWKWKFEAEGVKLNRRRRLGAPETFVELTEALVASSSDTDRMELVCGEVTVQVPDRFATAALDRVFEALEVRR